MHDLCNTFLNGSSIDSLCKLSRHGDTALTATMQNTTFAPLRTNFRNLAQRYRGVGFIKTSRNHRSGRRNAKVRDIGEGHVGIVFDNDGQFVITLPNLSYPQVAGGGTKSQLGCGTCNTQLGRGHWIEFYVYDRIRLEKVCVYPLQFRHFPHTVHQPLCHHMEGVEIIAIETILQFADLQIVKALELHIGIREGLA